MYHFLHVFRDGQGNIKGQKMVQGVQGVCRGTGEGHTKCDSPGVVKSAITSLIMVEAVGVVDVGDENGRWKWPVDENGGWCDVDGHDGGCRDGDFLSWFFCKYGIVLVFNF